MAIRNSNSSSSGNSRTERRRPRVTYNPIVEDDDLYYADDDDDEDEEEDELPPRRSGSRKQTTDSRRKKKKKKTKGAPGAGYQNIVLWEGQNPRRASKSSPVFSGTIELTPEFVLEAVARVESGEMDLTEAGHFKLRCVLWEAKPVGERSPDYRGSVEFYGERSDDEDDEEDDVPSRRRHRRRQ